MTRVSVLMTAYNGERYLREAVDSVLGQTERDIELVVVNDGSTDGTDALLRSYTDPRVHYIDSPHVGRVGALNLGARECRGEYVAILDADDVYLPEKLEKQVAFMHAHDLEISGAWASVIDEEGAVTGEMTYPPVGERSIRLYSLLHCPFIHSTVMMKRVVFVAAGFYRTFRYGVEDYELWTRLIYRHRTDNLPEELIKYRRHATQATKKLNIKMRLNAVRVRVLALLRFLRSLLS